MFKNLIASMALACCVFSTAQAASVEQANSEGAHDYLDLQLPETAKTFAADNDEIISPVFLAAADGQSSSKMKAMVESGPAVDYEDRLFTGNTIHKYLGIGSIAAAVLTALSPKEEDGPHEYFAKTSAVLGVGAVATGLGFHYEDIGMDGGLKDPDNLHALWAGLGAAGIAYAAAIGPDSPHQTFGSVGAIAMIIGVKYTW